MNEHILAAAIGLDKSITLLRVEPLHCSVAHGTLLCRNQDMSRAQHTARLARDFGERSSVRRGLFAAWPSSFGPKTRSNIFSGKPKYPQECAVRFDLTRVTAPTFF